MRTTGKFAVVALALALPACASPGVHPPLADLVAVTEKKPRPPATILTDPAANDRYNSAIEATLDRVHAAAMRLCRFHARTGMAGLDCSGE